LESPSKTHPKRIGIYGGTFDPIHLGHICLAIEMLEAHHLTEIWFCPAQASPFKKEGASASAQHREAMVRLAIRGIPQLKCSRVDLDRPAPSYTVDTLRLLHQQASKETKFYLILGEDSAETFFCWHQPEEIIKLSQVIIGKRTIQTPLSE
jgi:nicotinate-nucleotide adenylyltransferase